MKQKELNEFIKETEISNPTTAKYIFSLEERIAKLEKKPKPRTSGKK